MSTASQFARAALECQRIRLSGGLQHRRALAWTFCLALTLGTSIASKGQLPAPPKTDGVTTLEPDKPVERELSGGQKHVYQIPLSEGQNVKVIVRRQGINVGVNLRVPGGQTFPLLDGIFAGPPEWTFRQVAESSGIYQLDIYARAKDRARCKSRSFSVGS